MVSKLSSSLPYFNVGVNTQVFVFSFIASGIDIAWNESYINGMKILVMTARLTSLLNSKRTLSQNYMKCNRRTLFLASDRIYLSQND